MFRHKENTTSETEKKPEPATGNSGVVAASVNKTSATESVKSDPSLKELIEKNLKWSQIIYEQNRKINNKLLWSAIADWLRVFLILIPLVLGILFIPALFKGVMSQYGDLLGVGSEETTQQNSMDNFLKLFNLDPAKQEQLKALLK
jgi:hypothetical protein